MVKDEHSRSSQGKKKKQEGKVRNQTNPTSDSCCRAEWPFLVPGKTLQRNDIKEEEGEAAQTSYRVFITEIPMFHSSGVAHFSLFFSLFLT